MPDKRKYLQMIGDSESKYGFSNGFKLLYCPWKVISEADIAFISLNPGRTTNKTPIKPITTADHLLTPTFSFNIITERRVTIIGDIKARVRASAKDITEIE